MEGSSVQWVVLMMLVSLAWSSPVSYHDKLPDARPLADLGQRLVSHSSLLEARGQDPRLPLPTPQDIEAIKKVAQILVMLGEQHNKRNQEQVDMLNGIVDILRTLGSKPARKHKYVIPAIVGDSGAPHSSPPAVVEEIPNDPVEA